MVEGREAPSDPGLLGSIALTYAIQGLIAIDYENLPYHTALAIHTAAKHANRLFDKTLGPTMDACREICDQVNAELHMLDWGKNVEDPTKITNKRQPSGGILFRVLLLTLQRVFVLLDDLNTWENRGSMAALRVREALALLARLVFFSLALSHVCLIQPADICLREGILPAALKVVSTLLAMLLEVLGAFLRGEFGIVGSLAVGLIFVGVFIWVR